MERVGSIRDLHNHILPGLDDGAPSLEVAVEMAEIAVAEGIDTIVATPHTLDGVHDVPRGRAVAARDLLARELAAAGIDLRLRVAGEVRLHEAVPDLLARQPEVTLDGGGRYLLLELPVMVVPEGLPDFLFRLRAGGTTPVVAHPERCAPVIRDPTLVATWIRSGARIQVTAAALTGTFGRGPAACAERLLEAGSVHFLATDAHSVEHRPPRIQDAIEVAAGVVGRAGARALAVDNPGIVLRGGPPADLVGPTRVRRRGFSMSGWWS